MNSVWQPMMKMICIGPNCFMFNLRLRWMANASLTTKMTEKRAMLTTDVMFNTDATLLTNKLCHTCTLRRPKIMNLTLMTTRARRMLVVIRQTSMEMKMMSLWYSRLSVQQTMCTCSTSEL